MSNPYGQNPGDPQNPYSGQPGGVPGAEAPGIGLAKIGFILAVIPCTATIGLILCIVAAVQSKNAGVPNPKAKNGIIVACVWLALSIIFQIIAAAMGLYSGSM
ncbi:hypothetical protein [Auraticoccus monumenti]|uniref:DUF4190 domain-containing protein n=1 Tax=Auraticoccus monumenti TaxID=675864 RepID=A0A1G6XP27_9ACTN|nr:hypothetical protein [Auraticoccus monumenti]SDD79928.1 hypothetical protein SAMN04489747_1764 [Auraticoccus monumenti]